MEISHFDLCKLTAEKFLKQSKIILYEYQSVAVNEFPDVLRFKNGNTFLYEIKVTKQDFKKDAQKECRQEKKIKFFPEYRWDKKNIVIKTKFTQKYDIREFIIEKPHLGNERYYVCPSGLIQPDEIQNGWGLYWYNGKTLRMKKESKSFRANKHAELRILEHAFRKYYSGNGNNILVNGYELSPFR